MAVARIESDDDAGSAKFTGFNPDVTPAAIDDVGHHRQADALSLHQGVSPGASLQYVFLFILRYARAVIFHHDPQSAGTIRGLADPI